MKLATLRDSSRDGRLAVVSHDMQRMVLVPDVAPTMLAALEHWDAVEPPLREVAERLEADSVAHAEPFDPTVAAAPLPRCYQWLDGSAFTNHGRLMMEALDPGNSPPDDSVPLVYQGASDDFIGATEDVVVDDEADGIDFEGEVAIILDETPMRTGAAAVSDHIKLVMLCNDVSLRRYAFAELQRFGFVQSKPSSAFSPVAVTPDELGDAWHDGRLHRPLRVEWNGQWFGHPNAGEMTFSFFDLVEHVTRTRRVRAGTIVGSGTVSNGDRSVGSACIAERRAIETIAQGSPITPFMRFGDRVRIEMLDDQGHSIFGAIDQRIAPLNDQPGQREGEP